MIVFEESIARLVGICEAEAGWSVDIERAGLIRDLKGRLRLVLEPKKGATWDSTRRDQLEAQIKNEVGHWFYGPVLWTDATQAEQKRIANAFFAQLGGAWPTYWPQEGQDPLGGPRPKTVVWLAADRVLAKQGWLEPPGKIWPKLPQTPMIVAFYSFKGGVGRTTSLAAVAWNLIKEGKKVILVDLDLEAPGLGPLMDPRSVGPGSTDYLMEAALGAEPTARLGTATVHGYELKYVSAGSMGPEHVQKLARLDYLHLQGKAGSPVYEGLQRLLKEIKKNEAPDYIFLDARAGIHDLGGLALRQLAHVAVLVGRDHPQGLQGLEWVLRTLPPRDLDVLVVQTFVDPQQKVRAREEYRDKLHPIFLRTLYRDREAPPSVEDAGEHQPWPVLQRTELAALQTFPQILKTALESEDFAEIGARLMSLRETVQ